MIDKPRNTFCGRTRREFLTPLGGGMTFARLLKARPGLPRRVA